MDWGEDGIQAAIAATGGNVFLLRRLASILLHSLPEARIDRVCVSAEAVERVLPAWRTDVAPVVREILSHVQRFYPDDFALLELLSEDAAAVADAIDDESQFDRLRRLGVIEAEEGGTFKASRIVALDPRSRPALGVRKEGYPTSASPTGDLVSMGEGSQVEFKETLRVPVGREVPERVLVGEVMQAILGLFNAQGGSVLIGVSDQPNVVGLGPDLKRFKGSRDELERFLTAKMKESLGPHSHRVVLRWEEFPDGIVARLDVPRAPEPVWAQGGLEAAQLGRLQVRQNATTTGLDAKDATVYMANHFGKG